MILIVPAEDLWKTVPELGLISRDNADEGTVNVTDDADTFCHEKAPAKIPLTKAVKHSARIGIVALLKISPLDNFLFEIVRSNSLPNLFAGDIFPSKTKPGRRANG